MNSGETIKKLELLAVEIEVGSVSPQRGEAMAAVLKVAILARKLEQEVIHEVNGELSCNRYYKEAVLNCNVFEYRRKQPL